MRNLTVVLYAIIIFIGYSCVKPKEVGKGEELSKAYFDIKKLLAEQEQLLDAQNPKVEKTTLIDEKEEKVVPEEILWKKELKLFEQVDINKPVLLRSYSIDTLKDQSGHKLVYKALNEDLKVRWMDVLLNGDGKAENIQASVKEENPIYTSERSLEIKLEDGKLKSYSLKGYQKVKTQDTTRYQMEAVLLW